MAAIVRTFWLIALCFFVTSCSTYRSVEISDTEDVSGGENEFSAVDLSPGDAVRVTLNDGAEIQGIYVSSSHDSLAIDMEVATTLQSNDALYQHQEAASNERHVLPMADISTMERQEANTAGSIAIAVLCVGLVAAVIAGNQMADDLNDPFFSD